MVPNHQADFTTESRFIAQKQQLSSRHCLEKKSEWRAQKWQQICGFHWASKSEGTSKWMVYMGKKPIRMDDFGGITMLGNIHMECTPTKNNLDSGEAVFQTW